MARVLDALGNRDRNQGPPAARPPRVAEAPEFVEGEVPFVEVGGPRDGLPATPAAPRSAPGAAPAPVVAAPGPRATPRNGPGLLKVAFRQVPPPPRAAPAPGRILSPTLIAHHDPHHPVSAQYRSLWEGMQAQLPPGQPQVVSFTAPGPRVGATTSVLNLAVTAAQRDKTRVVVVDGNWQAPAVAERLGQPDAPGLRDVLAGTLTLLRALREVPAVNLHLLAAGSDMGKGSVALAGEGMRALLRHLRGRFDWVLIDGPVWDGRPEVAALGAVCDAIYLVVPQAEAQAEPVERLLQVIPQQGGRLLGCVLTQP